MSTTQVHGDAAGSHQKEFTIVVNGTPQKVKTDDVSFAQIVNLAYNGQPPSGPDYVFTVTYRNAAGKKREGTLTVGQTVEIKDGTIFNVTATNKS